MRPSLEDRLWGEVPNCVTCLAILLEVAGLIGILYLVVSSL